MRGLLIALLMLGLSGGKSHADRVADARVSCRSLAYDESLLAQCIQADMARQSREEARAWKSLQHAGESVQAIGANSAAGGAAATVIPAPQQTDYRCQSDCLAQGYSYQYCNSDCSY